MKDFDEQPVSLNIRIKYSKNELIRTQRNAT